MRHALLAYAMRRGVPYRRVEIVTRKPVRPALVAAMLACRVESVTAWLEAA
jgi:hypothetical protein